MYFHPDFIKQIDIAIGTYFQGLSTKGVKIYKFYLNKLSDYTVNAVEHLILFILSYILLCLALYIIINRRNGTKFERKINAAKRVLIITAHPDDECMFFGPTIYKFVNESNCQVYLLCLSTGNKYGQGTQRKEELFKSCSVLGIKKQNVYIYNCTLLQDDPKTRWREDIIAQIVLRKIESLEIDTVITFDKHGVSRHSNHCSIYYAVAYLSMEKQIPNYCKIYTLESINLLRKYWLILDIPLSFLLSRHRYILKNDQKNVVLEAMRQHYSQYVWFRKLYVIFSRYMIINTLQQLDMIDLELDLTLDD